MTKKKDSEFDPSLWLEIQGRKVFLLDRCVDAYTWIFEAEKEVDRLYEGKEKDEVNGTKQA